MLFAWVLSLNEYKQPKLEPEPGLPNSVSVPTNFMLPSISINTIISLFKLLYNTSIMSYNNKQTLTTVHIYLFEEQINVKFVCGFKPNSRRHRHDIIIIHHHHQSYDRVVAQLSTRPIPSTYLA